jgi:hypothetical protein
VAARKRMANGSVQLIWRRRPTRGLKRSRAAASGATRTRARVGDGGAGERERREVRVANVAEDEAGRREEERQGRVGVAELEDALLHQPGPVEALVRVVDVANLMA